MRIRKRYIDKNKLILIFKRFRRNPLKVFIANDFDNHPTILRHMYLNTLISLGLIEQVPAIYKCGNKYKVRRTGKGYRLKKKNVKAKN